MGRRDDGLVRGCIYFLCAFGQGAMTHIFVIYLIRVDIDYINFYGVGRFSFIRLIN